MIFEEKFKDYKSLYLCVSGGVDSALGLYLICKHINENKLDTKITVATGVEPQPMWGRNDKNVTKIISIVSDMFPNINKINHIIKFLEGYERQDEDIKNKTFPKIKAMREMHENNWLNGDYDLGVSFQSSFAKLDELKKHPTLYNRSLSVGPENRNWTGKKIDFIRPHSVLKSWWQPFLNMTKKNFETLYVKHDLMYNLFPYTASCTGRAEYTNNFTKPCQKCFWCLEKYWAFGLFDLPQAYDL